MASSTVAGFDAIVIISFLLGLLLLSTAAFSSNIHRPPHWYGFIVPLFIYDIILMAGMGYQADVGPPKGLCTFQAVLLYSIPGWGVVAFGCYNIRFYLTLKNLIASEQNETKIRQLSRLTNQLLLLIPLLSFIGFLILNGLTVLLSSKGPGAKLENHLYCVPETHTGLYVGGAIMGAAMFMWSGILIKSGFLLRTHYSMLKRGDVVFQEVLSIYMRGMAISIVGSLIIGLYIWSFATKNQENILESYLFAFPSIIIFVIFATQRDVLKCWFSWHSKPQSGFKTLKSNPTPLETQTETMSGISRVRIDNWKNIGYNWGTRTGA